MTESISNQDKEKVKIFEDLDKEIIQEDLCCACGACIAYCESQSFDVIEFDGYTPKFKSEANKDNCKECGLCYFICPQTGTLEDLLNQHLNIQDEIGQIRDILAAKTTQKQIEVLGQDGGIVTTALYHLFEKNKIDAAVVSKYDEKLHTHPTIIFDKEDLLESAGTRYSISTQLLPLKDLYGISQQVQEEKGIYDIEQLRIAFVGTPCQVKALRKMQYLSVKPAHTIKYIISLFCFENFDYSKLYETIKEKEGIDPSEIKKSFIKGNFFIETEDGTKSEINIRDLDAAVRDHCKLCNDFTGRYSDISVGSTGAPEGYSMLLSRTEIGEELISDLISQQYIKQYVHPRDKESNWKEERKKRFKKMISYKKSK